MSTSNNTTKGQTHPSQRRYPAELRERAVRMVREATVEGAESFGVATRVARQLGIGPRVLTQLVKQAEIDRGQRAGVTTEERRRIAELKRENRELRRANEILNLRAFDDLGDTFQQWRSGAHAWPLRIETRPEVHLRHRTRRLRQLTS